MEPIWKLLGKGRFYSTSGGAARTYDLSTEDWGLEVQSVVYAVYITGKSSANAQIGVEHYHGGTPDVNAFVLLSSPVALAAVAGNTPTTLYGQTTSNTLPYFRARVTGDSTVGTEEWVEAEIWAGGKPF